MTENLITNIRTNVQAGKYDHCLEIAYSVLESLFDQKVSLRPQILDLYKTILKSEKNQGFNLAGSFLEMRKFAYEEPAMIGQVLDMLNTGLQSNKNDADSLTEAYGALGYIVTIDPSRAEKATATIQETLKSDKNNERSFKEAYFALGEIVKVDPSLAEKASAVIKKTEVIACDNGIADVFEHTLKRIEEIKNSKGETESEPSFNEEKVMVRKSKTIPGKVIQACINRQKG